MYGNKGKPLAVFIGIVLTAGMLAAGLRQQNWGLLTTALMLTFLIFAYLGFERGALSSREIGLIAVLGTVTAVARLPFAAIPNFQPVTFMVIVSGFVFGPGAGFMVGSTAALVSNFFLGHGPWTLWQMLGWGLAGISAGLLRKLRPRIGTAGMTLFCFAWGYLYGWIINLWFWTGFLHPLNWKSLLAACAASFWFDTLHALGNAVFYLTLGRRIIKILERFRKKITFTTLTKQPAGGEHHRDESMQSSQQCR